MDLRARLSAIVDPLPDGSAVSLPVEVLRAWINEESGTGMDLTVEEVGRTTGRAPSTVRTWCGAGLVPGAYKLRGKEWRVPRDALNALRDQGPAKGQDGESVDLGAWRKVGGGR